MTDTPDSIRTIQHSFPWTDKREWYWPKSDTKLYQVVDDVNDVEALVRRHCKGTDTVIQAGAACGIFPHRLTSLFRHVITCEPVDENFECAWRNLADVPVCLFHAGFGSGQEEGPVTMKQHPREQNNAGSMQIELGDSGHSSFVMLTIDGVAPKVSGDKDNPTKAKVDLIMLDLEGYELYALQGADETIKRDSPTIVIEDKGLGQKYGIRQHFVLEYMMKRHGYKIVEKIKRDVVMVKE